MKTIQERMEKKENSFRTIFSFFIIILFFVVVVVVVAGTVLILLLAPFP